MSMRQNPSSHKVNFLFHLQDTITAGLQALEDNRNLLKKVGVVLQEETRFEERAAQKLLNKRIEALHVEMVNGLRAQKDHLETLLGYVKDDLSLLHGRREVIKDQRAFLLTIFAAIFLPLSLATSIFGMNIDSSTSEGPRGFSAWVNATLDKLPSEESRHMTEVLGSLTATSGPLSHSWTVIGVTALCLLLSLPIYLAIGVIWRACFGFVVTYIRALPALFAISLAYSTIFGVHLVTELLVRLLLYVDSSSEQRAGQDNRPGLGEEGGSNSGSEMFSRRTFAVALRFALGVRLWPDRAFYYVRDVCSRVLPTD